MATALPKAADDAKTDDKPKTSLFNFSQTKEGDKNSLFGSKKDSIFSGNTGGGIFGKTTSVGPLFGGSGQTKNLFGNGSTSLFGPKKDGEEKPSLFGNQPGGKSLFDNKNSLFGGQANIFSKKNPFSNGSTNNEKEADKNS